MFGNKFNNKILFSLFQMTGNKVRDYPFLAKAMEVKESESKIREFQNGAKNTFAFARSDTYVILFPPFFFHIC